MAVWGWCEICDKLVPIRPAGYKWAGDRAREWYPHEHDNKDGKHCPGHKKAL